MTRAQPGSGSSTPSSVTRKSQQRLRGTTLLSAPLFVLGLMGCSFALALALWAAWNQGQLGPSFWLPFLLTAALGLGGFLTAGGCFLSISDTEVCDVVGWIPVQRIKRSEIQTARVRPGVWRWFELELQDGSVRIMLGAAPTQYPSRLLAGAEDQDLANLEMILGEE